MAGHLEIKYLLDKFPQAGYDYFTALDREISHLIKQCCPDKTYKFTGKILTNKSNGFVSAQCASEKDNILLYVPLGYLTEPEEY